MKPDYQFSDFVQKMIDSFSGKTVVVENVAEESGFDEILAFYANIISQGEGNEKNRLQYLLCKATLTTTFPLVRYLCNFYISLLSYFSNPSRDFVDIETQDKAFYGALNEIKKTLRNDVSSNSSETQKNSMADVSPKNAMGLSRDELNGELNKFLDYIEQFSKGFNTVRAVISQFESNKINLLNRGYRSTFNSARLLCKRIIEFPEKDIYTQNGLKALVALEQGLFLSFGEVIDIFTREANEIYAQSDTSDDSTEDDENDDVTDPEEKAMREEFQKWFLNDFEDMSGEKVSSQGEVYAKLRDQLQKQPTWSESIVKEYDELAQSKLSRVRFYLDGK